jgi:LDH2 family malate/lactate/ureidoglycolate dehydrogenase
MAAATTWRAAARRAAEVVRTSGPLWTASLVADRVAPWGVLGWWPDRVIAADALAGQVASILRAWGMAAPDVETAVPHILYADLHGIDSHGVAMLLHYERARAAGRLDCAARAAIVRETEGTALVDGGGGLGHLAADLAMKLAIARCRVAGLAAVAVRRSGHFGAAGSYVAMAAREGLIGFATTSAQEPAIVPTFGRDAMLGTNPIALAAPARRNPPFLLDMATSTASLGKVAVRWRKGRAIPRGWALDERGRETTSGRRAMRARRLTPLGAAAAMASYKGYGLAAAMEVLAAVLPGERWRAAVEPEVSERAAAELDAPEPAADQPDRPGLAAPHRVGHFFLCLDPARFRERGDFAADLDVLVDALRATPPADPRHAVLVAGDPEHAAAAERGAHGVPLPRAVVEDLRGVARRAGVAFVLDGAR